MGIPSQQEVLTSLFDDVTAGQDATENLAAGLTDDQKQLIISMVPQGATAQITNMDQSMTESTASVEVTLAGGGVQDYTVTFVRDGIGWVVSGLTLDFDSLDDGSDTSDDVADQDGAAADDGAADEGAQDADAAGADAAA